MRVLINGVCTLKPKTGVGHTTAELHRALARLYGERFWLYPGATITRVARRVLKTPNPPACRSPLSFQERGLGGEVAFEEPNPPTPFPKKEGGASGSGVGFPAPRCIPA